MICKTADFKEALELFDSTRKNGFDMDINILNGFIKECNLEDDDGIDDYCKGIILWIYNDSNECLASQNFIFDFETQSIDEDDLLFYNENLTESETTLLMELGFNFETCTH